MTDVNPRTGAGSLPEFDHPPVVEVALGVQFRPIPQLRPIELAGLRERWRGDYPIVQEQPALPPTLEADVQGMPSVQFTLSALPAPRLWFASEDQSRLIQLQPDRLIVNWRQRVVADVYPRYPTVRAEFVRRFEDVVAFLTDRGSAPPAVTQGELTYINAVNAVAAEGIQLHRLIRIGELAPGHHLGAPEQARLSLAFRVPDIGQGPVRLHVALNPGRRPTGEPAVFMTLTVRGAPTDETQNGALSFIDRAHNQIVHSFAELSPEEMHLEWGLRA